MELSICKNIKEAVLVEVLFDDMIDRMSNSGFSGEEKFIKVTKGSNHTITIYGEGARVICTFNFGDNGSTLISNDLRVLKSKVLTFILKQRIQIRNLSDTTEEKLKIILPRREGDTYCVQLGGDMAGFFKYKKEIVDMFGKYEVYNCYIAPTGVTVYEAKLLEVPKESVR